MRIVAWLEIPPDGYHDELALQAVACDACPWVGVANYEESRRGSGERAHHWAQAVSRQDFERLLADLRRCPDPHQRGCGCEVHVRYNQVEGYAWRGLAMFDRLGEPRPLRYRPR